MQRYPGLANDYETSVVVDFGILRPRGFGLARLLLMALVARTQPRDRAEEYKQFIVKSHTAMALKDGSMVADMGTGDSPDYPSHISNAIGPTGKLVGEDIDEPALQKRAAKMKEDGVENVQFVVGEPDNRSLQYAHAIPL
jgi:hypothetical protein